MTFPRFDKRSAWARIGGHDACAVPLGLLCLPCLDPRAQSDPQQRKVQAGAPEPLRSALATHVDKAPKVDGTIDDPLWNQASPIADFLQREPYEGQTPSEKTEVRVLYTKHGVYLGVTCFDTNPKGVVATELRRDVSQELDDYFEIIIDSAHDRRNAYVLQINPLVTQRDALVTEEQVTESGLGDGLWMGWRMDFRSAHNRAWLDCDSCRSFCHVEFHEVTRCHLGNQLQALHPTKE